MYSKAENPETLIDGINTHEIIKFYFAINHLKNVYRKGWLLSGIAGESCESVAEHSFGVAILAMVLAPSWSKALDTRKVVEMALIHDIGEIYTGDIVPGDNIDPDSKFTIEREAIHKVFKKLKIGEKYIQLWEEYHFTSSPEAQFVKQLDKLEMALQARIYEILQPVELPEFFSSVDGQIEDPGLKSILDNLKTINR